MRKKGDGGGCTESAGRAAEERGRSTLFKERALLAVDCYLVKSLL